MIYLDNAATTEICEPALSALIDLSKYQYGNASSSYSYGRKARQLLDDARGIISQCIGALPEEIFFTSGGTESNNWVMSPLSRTVDKVIVSSVEHHAILHPAERLKKNGNDVVVIPVDKGCSVLSEVLITSMQGKQCLVSIMFQNNETGVIQDIQSLASIVHHNNPKSIFHTDAVQAVGHNMINVHKLGVDMLSASAHKFNGPKGVGFLYVNKNCKIDALILGGGQEKGFRSGTENIPGIFSMAKALENNISLIEENEKHIKSLENLFYRELSTLGVKYKINGNLNKKASGVINIAIDGVDGEGLLNFLDIHDICVSIGSACNSESKNRSHVLLAMGLDNHTIDSSIRISIGRYNKDDEIIKLARLIKKYVEISCIAMTSS